MRRAIWTAVPALLVLSSLPVTAAGKDPAAAVAPAWTAQLWSVPTSGWTRETQVSRGTWIYTDPVFDDRGVDASSSTPGGDATYPADGAPYMRNAADLVELRVRRAGPTLVLGARLNTLLQPEVPVVSIGITDTRAAGLSRPWPDGSGLRAKSVRWVVTLTSSGATVRDLLTGASNTSAVVLANNTPAGARSLENTLSTRVRLPVQNTFSVLAAAGVQQGQQWYQSQAGLPAAFDLTFAPEHIVWAAGTGEEDVPGDWEQTVQSQVLAKGDVTSAELPVTFRDRAAPIPVGQARSRIYRPSIEMRTGEGIENNYTLQLVTRSNGTPLERDTVAPTGNFYKGLFLPYSVWVPDSYGKRPFPLFLNLHGITGTHQSHLFPNWPRRHFDVQAVAIQPMGRSEYGYYQHEAALDVFESLADVERHLRIDTNRVFLSGFSMGGVGTYTLATERPDVFAAALPIAGPGSGQGDFLWPVPAEPVMRASRDEIGLYRMGSFGKELLTNAYNVPFRIWHATLDQYVAQTWSESDAAEWQRLGYDYTFVNFTERTHVIVQPFVNAMYHEVADGCSAPGVPGCDDPALRGGPFVRDPNPARVVFKALPFSWAPEVGLRYDRAYWLSAIRARDTSSNDKYALVDAVSGPLMGKRRQPLAAEPLELRTFAPTGDPYRYQARRWTVAPARDTRELSLTLTNVGSLTVDLLRAGFTGGQAVPLRLVGDGATTIRLRVPWTSGSTVALSENGRRIASARNVGGFVTFRLALQGQHLLNLSDL